MSCDPRAEARRSRPAVLALVLASGLASGACAHAPLGPVDSYNTRWVGGLRLRTGQTLPVRLDVYSTRTDGRTTDPWGKHVFAEVAIGGQGPFAASGDASRFDRRDFDRVTHAPIAGREFLEVVLTWFGPEALDALQVRYAREESVEVRLLAEQRQGPRARLEGILVAEFSWTGACTSSERGRCVMWNVRFRRELLGSFSAERTGPAPPVERPGDSSIDTGRFLFRRQIRGTNGLSWDVLQSPRPRPPQ
jgi:hypothetical protein